MVASIVSTGLAIGCIYALIGITYNVMFSASRVFSFTAGTLGMLGGVLGSLFIARLGLPVAVGFLLALAGGVVLGIVTEIVAVRPVLKSLDQHLYVLSTLALALMVQQFTAIEWGTEARPFPRLFDIARGGFDQQFWLPMLACAAAIVGLELLYRHTLIGRAFLAIAEDTYAARALGLPERTVDFLNRLKSAKIDVNDTLLWWIAVGYDTPRLIAEAMRNAGTEPAQVVGYLNKLKGFPGVFGNISFTPDRHDGYPDDQVVMVEANSLKDGAFNLAPGYSA